MTIAYCSMAALMTGMVVTNVPQWMYVMAALALLGQAFHMAGSCPGRRATRMCTIDLTAMGALLLAMPSAGTEQVQAVGHYHLPSGAHPPWGPSIVLVCWLLATMLALVADRGVSRNGTVLGSFLMMAGMVPMVL
ncbi:hypothetical protein [Rhodococcus erythropolis]|uniref:hypothetical protein n=1 Tax=Rhodococcus erythropolis TaxID=1833 RepID=UPI00114CE2B3|nr:hypothetical protein [Rhodococcus erythropolis]